MCMSALPSCMYVPCVYAQCLPSEKGVKSPGTGVVIDGNSTHVFYNSSKYSYLRIHVSILKSFRITIAVKKHLPKASRECGGLNMVRPRE